MGLGAKALELRTPGACAPGTRRSYKQIAFPGTAARGSLNNPSAPRDFQCTCPQTPGRIKGGLSRWKIMSSQFLKAGKRVA